MTAAVLAFGLCPWDAAFSIASGSPTPALPNEYSTPQITARVPGAPIDDSPIGQDASDWYEELIGPIGPPRGVLNDLEWQGNVAVVDLSKESVESRSEGDLGPYLVLEYESDFAGTLFVSASALGSEGIANPWLRIFDLERATLAEDDDSGGGNAALIEIEVADGDYYEIHLGLREGEPPASVGLKVFEASESDETKALATALENASSLASEALAASDFEGARAIIRSALDAWSPAPESVPSLSVARAVERLGAVSYQSQDPQVLYTLMIAWLRFGERAFPLNHAPLQTARGNLALTLSALGDRPAARRLQEQVLAVFERTVPPDHLELQTARCNLAATLHVLGDLPAARRLQEQALRVFEETLAPTHPHLLGARNNLAGMLHVLGELPAARRLQEQVLSVLEESLPSEHPHLQLARNNLAETLHALGDLRSARRLQEEALAVFEETLPPDHAHLQSVRGNLALTLRALGDLAVAHRLQEQVLAVLVRTLPADSWSVQAARSNLAVTLHRLGDVPASRVLEEQVVAVFERTLPPDHPDLQTARANLALTIRDLGDLPTVRRLQERVLAVLKESVHADHRSLQTARHNLAATLHDLGDLPAAARIQEQVLEVFKRTLPPDHPDLQAARGNLARILFAQGDLPSARRLEEQVLAVRVRTHPPDHPDLRTTRGNLARTLTRSHEREETMEITRELVRGSLAGLRTQLALSFRQWEMLSEGQEWNTSWSLSLSAHVPETLAIADQFELSESHRCTGASRQRLERQLFIPVEHRTAIEVLDRAILERTSELTTAALRTTPVEEGEPAGSDGARAFASLKRDLERLQVQRSALLQELARAQDIALEPTVEAIASALPDGTAAVGFWRYRRWPIDFDAGVIGRALPSYLAFVVRKDAPAKRIELGEAAEIERALTARQAAIGAPIFRGIEVEGGEVNDESIAGHTVRELVFDPLREALGDCRHVILALDSTLHLVPFGALPGSGEHGEEGLLAESWDLDISTTLKELTSRPPKPLHPPRLVVFGGIDYDSEADPDAGPDSVASATSPDGVDRDSVNRSPQGGPGDRSDTTAADVGSRTARDQTYASRRIRGSRPHSHKVFGHLDATASEAEDIASRFRGRFGTEGGEPHIRLGAAATRDEFTRLAPRARFLHLATHAYVEDESIPAITDLRRQDHEPLVSLSDRRAEVRGLSPMSICGVALAGSNLKDPESGAPVGWFTAAELAELDLSGCELVVLSTCESHVGLERAGQGLASLQQAAFVAGARSTLTSVWRVPDSPTRDFMSRFYELWWDHGLTKREALVETQKWMRDARDPDTDEPMYRTRDWAAWVLVGREE